MEQSVLKRSSTAEAIVDHFKRRIAAGELKPGDRLPGERVLQQELKISRLALREGLARLAAVGIVQIRHGKGAYIASAADATAAASVLMPLTLPLTRQRLDDLLDARALVESETAALAARRRTKADLDRLQQLLEIDASTVQDTRQFVARDRSFHRTVAEIAGNPFMVTMLDSIWPHIESFLAMFAASGGDRKAAMERHRPILQAIARRDAEKARRLARVHSVPCRSYYHAYFSSQRHSVL